MTGLPTRWIRLGILGVIGLAALSARAMGQEVDEDEATLRRALAERSFRENCLICHGAEMTTSQRLTAEQWKAEMTKMLGWGTPVPPEQVDDLTAWLIAEFPPDRPEDEPRRESLNKQAESRIAADRRPTDGRGDRGAALYATHCANCHGTDAQGGDLGPNLVERPALVRDDEWASAVRDGRNRMPGYRAVLDAGQEADLRAWLLGLAFRSRAR